MAKKNSEKCRNPADDLRRKEKEMEKKKNRKTRQKIKEEAAVLHNPNAAKKEIEKYEALKIHGGLDQKQARRFDDLKKAARERTDDEQIKESTEIRTSGHPTSTSSPWMPIQFRAPAPGDYVPPGLEESSESSAESDAGSGPPPQRSQGAPPPLPKCPPPPQVLNLIKTSQNENSDLPSPATIPPTIPLTIPPSNYQTLVPNPLKFPGPGGPPLNMVLPSFAFQNSSPSTHYPLQSTSYPLQTISYPPQTTSYPPQTQTTTYGTEPTSLARVFQSPAESQPVASGPEAAPIDTTSAPAKPAEAPAFVPTQLLVKRAPEKEAPLSDLPRQAVQLQQKETPVLQVVRGGPTSKSSIDKAFDEFLSSLNEEK